MATQAVLLGAATSCAMAAAARLGVTGGERAGTIPMRSEWSTGAPFNWWRSPLVWC